MGRPGDGNNDPQAKQQPRLVSRASPEWEATGTRASTAPPGPGASLRARIAGEIARARSRPLRPAVLRALTCSPAAIPGFLSRLVTQIAGSYPKRVVIGVRRVSMQPTTAPALAAARTHGGFGEASAQRIAARTAAAGALESAGWALLHDRLVADHVVIAEHHRDFSLPESTGPHSGGTSNGGPSSSASYLPV